MEMPRRRDLRVDIHDANLSARSFGSFSTEPSVYTPTSGRSTPFFHPDAAPFEQCFAQGSQLQYGFSPASSVASSQEYHNVPGLEWDFNSSFTIDNTPSTPSRCSNHSSQMMAADNSFLQYTPTSNDNMNFDTIMFNDPFSPAPFVTPSRTFYVQPSHSPEDMGCWPVLESSPLSYRRQQQRPTFKREHEPPIFNFREHVGLGPVQQKSAALQQVASMQRVHRAPRMKKRSSKEEAEVAPRKEMIPCVETTTVQKRRLPCPWKGCDAAFTRREHLTRHHKGKHLGIVDAVCKCCEDQNIHKSFDRHDNFLTHLALHVSGEGRVKFHPDAARMYSEELAKVKRRAPSKRHLQKQLARKSMSTGESQQEEDWVKSESP